MPKTGAHPGPATTHVLVCGGCRQKVMIAPEHINSARCPHCGMIFKGVKPAITRSPGRWRRWFYRLVLAYLVLIVLAVGVLRLWDESWSVNSLMLFAPRWALLLPLLILVPVALRYSRRSLIPLTAVVIFYLAAISGFRVSRHWTDPPDEPNSLRVVTCNTGGGQLNVRRLRQYLRDERPDVVAIQEWDTRYRELVFDQSEWTVVESQGMWVASRRTITPVDGVKPGQFELPGGAGAFELITANGPVRFVNVHLPTVRDGLEAVVHRQPGGHAALEANAGARDRAGATARLMAQQGVDPLIVAGDFNVPVESSVYRHHWGDLTDAFDSAGIGFGYSKFTHWHGVRIDHILFDANWQCSYCAVGPDLGLDHRPVLAVIMPADGR